MELSMARRRREISWDNIASCPSSFCPLAITDDVFVGAGSLVMMVVVVEGSHWPDPKSHG